MESNPRTHGYLVFNRVSQTFLNVLYSALSDLFVTCQLIADNKPLTIPFQTSHKTFKNSYTSAFNLTLMTSLSTFLSRWNEWVTLPIRYCDLPLSSQITFTVWDIAGPRAAAPVGGTTFRLFSKKWCGVLLARTVDASLMASAWR